MNEIRVQIPHDLSAEVERRFFEYNAAKDIIKYLMSQEEVLEKNLDRYLNSAEARFAELELIKEEATNQYKPEGLVNYGYEFDFKNCEIIYKVN